MALFKLGAIVATPGALQFCEEHSIDPLALIGRTGLKMIPETYN